MKQNKDIRAETVTARVKLWEIAEEMVMADSGLSRMMRKELSDEDKKRIRSAIRNIILSRRKE